MSGIAFWSGATPAPPAPSVPKYISYLDAQSVNQVAPATLVDEIRTGDQRKVWGGKVAYFNGTTAYFDVVGGTALTYTNMTVCCFFRTAEDFASAILWDAGTSFLTRVDYNNGDIAIVHENPSQTNVHSSHLSFLSADYWYHVAVVKTGDSYQVYVNAIAAGGAQTGDTTYNVRYFGGLGTSPPRFEGRMTDLRIYDKALTQSEVEWVYHNGAIGTDPTATNLQRLYRFESRHASTAYDASGNSDRSLGNVTVTTNYKGPRNAWKCLAFQGGGTSNKATLTAANNFGTASSSYRFEMWYQSQLDFYGRFLEALDGASDGLEFDLNNGDFQWYHNGTLCQSTDGFHAGDGLVKVVVEWDGADVTINSWQNENTYSSTTAATGAVDVSSPIVVNPDGDFTQWQLARLVVDIDGANHLTWDVDELTGTTIADSVGSNDGTLSSGNASWHSPWKTHLNQYGYYDDSGVLIPMDHSNPTLATNGLALTYSGDAPLSALLYVPSRDYSTVADYYTASTTTNLGIGTGSYSICAWTKGTNTGWGYVFDHARNTGNAIGFGMSTSNNHYYHRLGTSTQASTLHFYSEGDYGIHDGNWHWGCFTNDRTTLTCYIDNAFAYDTTPGTLAGDVDDSGQSRPFYVGKWYASGGFNVGSVGHIMIFDKVLTADERTWVYTFGASGVAPPAPKLYYPLQVVDGTGKAWDISASGIHLDPIGSPATLFELDRGQWNLVEGHRLSGSSRISMKYDKTGAADGNPITNPGGGDRLNDAESRLDFTYGQTLEPPYEIQGLGLTDDWRFGTARPPALEVGTETAISLQDIYIRRL